MSKKHRNVHKGGTLTGVRRNKTAALTLAVSLWLAGGGVALIGLVLVPLLSGLVG